MRENAFLKVVYISHKNTEEYPIAPHFVKGKRPEEPTSQAKMSAEYLRYLY